VYFPIETPMPFPTETKEELENNAKFIVEVEGLSVLLT
jgi:hypothetical protein